MITNKPKRIYITIDTECHNKAIENQYIYGKMPNGDVCGIQKILEEAQKIGIPLNFFVDIPEWNQYGEKHIQDMVDMIHSYNQTICFHFHPNYASGDHSRWNLYEYSKEEQKKMLQQGMKDFFKFCGKKDVLVFRAGCYGVNLETMDVLSNLGVKCVDLSYNAGDGKGMCHISESEILTKNVPVNYKGIIIQPNTTYIGFDYLGLRKFFPLNVAQTPYGEFVDFMDKTKLDNIIYTMHSWDFILKWFFNSNKVCLNKLYVKRFHKCIKYAHEKGYSFASLDDYEYVPNQKDEIVDLYDTIWGKVKGILYNFERFWGVAHFSAKYLIVYVSFFLGVFLFLGIISLMFFI